MKIHTRFAVGVLITGIGLWVAACSQPHGPPLLTECETGKYTISIHFMDRDELASVYERGGGQTPERGAVLGFAAVDAVTGEKHIMVPRVRGQDDHETIETIGHELMHIACGSWHPNPIT